MLNIREEEGEGGGRERKKVDCALVGNQKLYTSKAMWECLLRAKGGGGYSGREMGGRIFWRGWVED